MPTKPIAGQHEKRPRPYEYSLLAFLSAHPGWTIELHVRRPDMMGTDDYYIPENVQIGEDKVLRWWPEKSDTYVLGIGEMQVWAISPDGEREVTVSPAIRTSIDHTVSGGMQDPPPAFEPYFKRVLEAAEAADTAAGRAEDAAGRVLGLQAQGETLEPDEPARAHYDPETGVLTISVPRGRNGEPGEPGRAPMIGTGGTWLVWDADSGSYVDTGIKAKGETPERGVDYWTAQDKQEIVQDVRDEFPAVDQTLTVDGAAADAGVVGEKVRELRDDKLDKNPALWADWTDEQQATIQHKIGIISVEGVSF